MNPDLDTHPPRDSEMHEKLGRHGAQIEGVKEDIDELRDEMRQGFKALNEKLDPLVSAQAQGKGAVKFLVVLWTVLSAAGSFFAGMFLQKGS